MDLTFARPTHLAIPAIAYRYLLAIPLALFALASFAVKYIQDDVADIARVQQYGVIGAAHYWYNIWTGRYTYDVVVHASKLTPIWLPSLVTIALLLGGLYLLLSRLDMALLLGVAILAIAPTAQSFFWQSALLNYGLPLALLVWWLYYARRNRELVCLLLVFTIVGLSDTLAVLMPLVLVGWTIFTPKQRHWTSWLVLAVSLALWFAAPGNANRMSVYPHAPLPLVILVSLRQTGLPIAAALKSNWPVALSIAILPGLVWPMRRDSRLALLIAIGILTVSFVTVFACYYTLLMAIPLRTIIVPIALILSGVFVLSRMYVRLNPRWIVPILIVVILCASVQAVRTIRTLQSPIYIGIVEGAPYPEIDGDLWRW